MLLKMALLQQYISKIPRLSLLKDMIFKLLLKYRTEMDNIKVIHVSSQKVDTISFSHSIKFTRQ